MSDNPVKPIKRMAISMLRVLRRRGDRDLFWWKGPPLNFGDLVGPYIFEKITKRKPRWRLPTNRALTTVFVSAGSLGRFIREDCVVWGTGMIRSDSFVFRPSETCAVRGPLTRARFLQLGYPCPPVYGDPGILLPVFYPGQAGRTLAIGIVPHYVDFESACLMFGSKSSVKVIDVRRPVEAVVDDITSCEVIVSSSLHGLVVAHAYGIPAAWVKFSDGLAGDGTKFRDYYGACSLDAKVTRIPRPVSTAELERLGREAPLPNLEPLVRPLLETCPFPAPWGK